MKTFPSAKIRNVALVGHGHAGKTTLAGKLAKHLKAEGHTPMLVACDLQRPNAVKQLQVNGERAGVTVYAPEPGNGVGDPVVVARGGVEEARRTLHDVVIVDTPDALLVTTMANSQRVKAAVDALKASGDTDVL